ncbi:hypothetical protein CBL_06698 [Carabus blaptoides fortunei]
MASESTGLSIIFKVAKIICSLCAFICAMVLAAPWQMTIALFFNIIQLVVLVYATVVLLLRVTNVLKINLWKIENVTSMVLGSLEFAATSVWAVNITNNTHTTTNPIAKAVFNLINTHVNTAGASINVTAMTSMVVFGYFTGIICILHGVYVVLTN